MQPGNDIQDSQFDQNAAQGVAQESVFAASVFSREEDVEDATPSKAKKEKPKKEPGEPMSTNKMLFLGGGGVAALALVGMVVHTVLGSRQPQQMILPPQQHVVAAGNTSVPAAHPPSVKPAPVATPPAGLAPQAVAALPALPGMQRASAPDSALPATQTAAAGSLPQPPGAPSTPPAPGGVTPGGAVPVGVPPATGAVTSPTTVAKTPLQTAPAAPSVTPSPAPVAVPDEVRARSDAQIIALQEEIAQLKQRLATSPASGSAAESGRPVEKRGVPHHRSPIARWSVMGVIDQTAVLRLPNGSTHTVRPGSVVDGVHIQSVSGSFVQTSAGVLKVQ